MSERVASARGGPGGRKGLHGTRSGSGHLTGDFLLADRRFYLRSNAWGVDALYDWLGSAFGVIVATDGQEPHLALRLGDFLRACRFRERTQQGAG